MIFAIIAGYITVRRNFFIRNLFDIAPVLQSARTLVLRLEVFTVL